MCCEKKKVLRKEDTDWVKKCMEYEVEGSRPRGRSKRTWKEVVQKDCQARNLNKEDAMDRGRWKKLIKTGWWSGWWVGECFFWYRLTRVVRTKGSKTVVVVVVVHRHMHTCTEPFQHSFPSLSWLANSLAACCWTISPQPPPHCGSKKRTLEHTLLSCIQWDLAHQHLCDEPTEIAVVFVRVPQPSRASTYSQTQQSVTWRLITTTTALCRDKSLEWFSECHSYWALSRYQPTMSLHVHTSHECHSH